MKFKTVSCSLLLAVFLSLLCVDTALAQEKKLSGKVVGTAGAPVDGASVVVKGTKIGTTTKADGSFALTVPGSAQTLVVSNVGFDNKEVSIGKGDFLEISIAAATNTLNDVIVVGYGTQKKKEITAAVTSIKAESFNKGNVSDVSQLLQGKVAGLSIARPGGDPNSGFAIRLRGLSTIGANASPLVVVDGQVGIDINTVDPNDIASIDVLKDGASAAIYGTRGSAGVILITTKRGTRGGGPQVSYNGTVSAEKAVKFTDHFSADEYVAAGGTDYKARTDWNKEITRTAVAHTHNLSLSGGGNGTSYTASVNYRNNPGIAITTGFQQLNGHFGLTQKALKDKLVFTIDASDTKRTSQFGWSDAFKYATVFNPTAPVHSTDPLYDKTGGGYFEQDFVDYANPVALLEQNTNKRVTKRNTINGSATYEIVHGVKFSVRYAQENSSQYNWVYLPKKSFYVRSFLGVSGVARNGFAYKRDDEATNQLYENTLSYEGKIKKLSIAAVGGYSYQDFLYNGYLVQAGNFVSDAVAEDFSASQDFKDGKAFSSSYKNGSKLVAFFGRLNLNYNDVAFLSASLRREGSTQFGENNKWGMFPAVSAGLDINKLVHLDNINNLKVRASYGVTGALPPGSYLSQFLWGPVGTFFYNGNYVNSYQPTQNQNANLKWEKKGEFDIGLDFAAFGNRLTGTFDYYKRTTSDLIFNVNVPVPPNLTSLQYNNIGTLKSNGVELQLGYDVIRSRDLVWNTGLNFSTYHVKLASLNKDLAGSYVGASNLGTPGQEATQITRAVEGEDIGLLYGAIYRGLDQTGHYLYDDGAGGTTTDNTKYRTKIGNGLPKFELGWTNTFPLQSL